MTIITRVDVVSQVSACPDAGQSCSLCSPAAATAPPPLEGADASGLQQAGAWAASHFLSFSSLYINAVYPAARYSLSASPVGWPTLCYLSQLEPRCGPGRLDRACAVLERGRFTMSGRTA